MSGSNCTRLLALCSDAVIRATTPRTLAFSNVCLRLAIDCPGLHWSCPVDSNLFVCQLVAASRCQDLAIKLDSDFSPCADSLSRRATDIVVWSHTGKPRRAIPWWYVGIPTCSRSRNSTDIGNHTDVGTGAADCATGGGARRTTRCCCCTRRCNTGCPHSWAGQLGSRGLAHT